MSKEVILAEQARRCNVGSSGSVSAFISIAAQISTHNHIPPRIQERLCAMTAAHSLLCGAKVWFCVQETFVFSFLDNVSDGALLFGRILRCVCAGCVNVCVRALTRERLRVIAVFIQRLRMFVVVELLNSHVSTSSAKTILPCPYISVSFSCCNVLLSCSTSSGLPPRENLLSLSSTRRPSLSASSFTSQVRRRGSKLPRASSLFV